jgi:hypothetical protein
LEKYFYGGCGRDLCSAMACAVCGTLQRDHYERYGFIFEAPITLIKGNVNLRRVAHERRRRKIEPYILFYFSSKI